MNGIARNARPKKYTFLATQTYITIGGMQKFNRRFIQALLGRATEETGKLCVVLRTDTVAHIPRGLSATFFACGTSKIKFVISSLIACRQSDIIFVGLINLLPIAFLCRILNPQAKMVLIVHGDDVWGDPTYRSERWYDKYFLRRVDRIVSVSSFTARRMQKFFKLSDDRFRIFLNAVDPLDYRPSSRTSAREVLSVSRLDSHDHGKNLDKVLRAVALLTSHDNSLHYTIVGDGALRPVLEKLVDDLRINDHVTFAGRLSDEELSLAYSNADVFVLPSEKEGFGIVFLEAWQRELPVICGTDDAAAEIVEDSVDGFAVDPYDIDLLASKIKWLLDNPSSARTLGRAGAVKVNRMYLDVAYRARLEYIINELEV